MIRVMGKMGGWWRLWIVVSASWAALIAALSISAFPTDSSGKAWIGKDYPITITNIPIMGSDNELIKKLERMRYEKREYARLIEESMAGRSSKEEFRHLTKSFRFKPVVGWSTGDVPPLGPITIESTPRRRFMTWLSTCLPLLLGLPLLLLIVGLSIRWVKDGFSRNRSMTN